MEAAMTATDNSYVASGVGTYGDFIASPGKATQPAIWGFLTAASQARFSVGGLFSGWYWGVQGLGGSPDNSGRVGPPPNDFFEFRRRIRHGGQRHRRRRHIRR